MFLDQFSRLRTVVQIEDQFDIFREIISKRERRSLPAWIVQINAVQSSDRSNLRQIRLNMLGNIVRSARTETDDDLRISWQSKHLLEIRSILQDQSNNLDHLAIDVVHTERRQAQR